MGKIIDPLNEEEQQEVYDGIRAMIVESMSFVFAEATRRHPSCVWTNRHGVDTPVYDKTQGQHHLELDETQIQSTGKSVSVEDVIAKIDELTTDTE